jgi:hypothetical protein
LSSPLASVAKVTHRLALLRSAFDISWSRIFDFDGYGAPDFENEYLSNNFATGPPYDTFTNTYGLLYPSVSLSDVFLQEFACQNSSNVSQSDLLSSHVSPGLLESCGPAVIAPEADSGVCVPGSYSTAPEDRADIPFLDSGFGCLIDKHGHGEILPSEPWGCGVRASCVEDSDTMRYCQMNDEDVYNTWETPASIPENSSQPSPL